MECLHIKTIQKINQTFMMLTMEMHLEWRFAVRFSLVCCVLKMKRNIKKLLLAKETHPLLISGKK